MICLSTFLKDFSSENTGPISIKFHMQPLGKGGKKIYIFCPGHITKMATWLYNIKLKRVMIRNSRWPPCPYMVKTIYMPSYPEPPGGLG